MSASLVGSEMCIRDRACCRGLGLPSPSFSTRLLPLFPCSPLHSRAPADACLLYTSDAADDM
eukprot:3790857-Alexandrium_andersonii.AAC.1